MLGKPVNTIRWIISIPLSLIAMGVSHNIALVYMSSFLNTNPDEFSLFTKFYPAAISGMALLIVGNLVAPEDKTPKLDIILLAFTGINFIASLALNDLSDYESYDVVVRCFGQLIGALLITIFNRRD